MLQLQINQKSGYTNLQLKAPQLKVTSGYERWSSFEPPIMAIDGQRTPITIAYRLSGTKTKTTTKTTTEASWQVTDPLT